MMAKGDEQMYMWLHGLIKGRYQFLLTDNSQYSAHEELFLETFRLWLMVAIRAANISLAAKSGTTQANNS